MFYFDTTKNRLNFLNGINNVRWPSRIYKIIRRTINKITHSNKMCFADSVDELVKIDGSLYFEYYGFRVKRMTIRSILKIKNMYNFRGEAT